MTYEVFEDLIKMFATFLLVFGAAGITGAIIGLMSKNDTTNINNEENK